MLDPSLQSRIIVPPGSLKPGALFISCGYELCEHEALCMALQEGGFRVIIAPWFSLALDSCGIRVCRGLEIIGSGVYREICDWETISPHFIFAGNALRGEALNVYWKCIEINSNAILGWLPDASACKLGVGLPFCIQSDRPLTAGHADVDMMDKLGARPVPVELFAILDFANLCGRLLDAQLSCGLRKPEPEGSTYSEVKEPANIVAAFTSRVDGLRPIFDLAVTAIFAQALESDAIATAPHLSRFFLPILIRVEMSHEVARTRCLVVEADIAFSSETASAPERQDVRNRYVSIYARELRTRCIREPYIHIPSPSFSLGKDDTASPVLQLISFPSVGPLIEVPNLHKQMNSFEGRARLMSALSSRLEQLNSLEIVERPDDRISYTISRDSLGSLRLDIRLNSDSDMSFLRHPLASVLPGLATDDHIIDTVPWPGAEFADIDPDLRGPVVANLASNQSLLLYLGRVIANASSDFELHGTAFEKIGTRFIEPGVGRTCLADFLTVEGRPELHDFSVTGIGLTPYSQGGFAEMGSRPTGRAALARALHRKRCAQRLEECGCRTTPVFAIIRLPELTVSMPDGRESPAALIVRGFRMAIRVKQLDPIACFYHSHQHAAALMGFVHDPGWQPGSIPQRSNLDHSVSAFLQAASLDAQGALTDELARIARAQGAVPIGDAADPDQREKWALSRRLQILRAYAPLPLKLSRIRLARELGRDPERELPSEFEYVCWFATSMGHQLARMRRVRFLHDYHHQGMSRYKPGWVNTLVDNNVTLMAEFPDLDTGIFLDRDDPSMREELQLTSQDFAVLVDGYEMAHNSELEKAKTIVDTLTSIVSYGDPDWLEIAQTHFSRAYENDSAEDLADSWAPIDKPDFAFERR